MATGSGLDAQVGCAPESAWGTTATPTRFPEFVSESLSMTPEWLEPSAIRAGQKHKRAGRVRQSRRSVGGDLVLEHATKGMGLFWKHALGSALASPAQIDATTAYRQRHVPGDYRGLGLTVQVGRPEPGSGQVKAFTYTGCKVASWGFAVRDQEVPQLTLTFDGRDELDDVALATAAFVAGAGVFDFSQATLKLGGTPSIDPDGLVAITGGAPVATIIREMSVAGETPMATERFGLGNAGLKAQQLENGTPTITGSFGAEFDKAELYDAFANNTTLPVVMEMVGGPIGATGHNDRLRITMPACKIKGAAPQVGGPDIIEMSSEFEAYHDETHPPIEVVLISTDTAL